jgi:hypothetical protein
LKEVLFDAADQTSLPMTMPVYDFGVNLARNGLSLCYAVVDAQRSRHDLHFLETVALNRGARIRIFDSPDEALGWLRASRARSHA